MAEDFDVAIIGAGHNGLTCASYLARAGLRVGVFEARGVVGGAAVTEEFHPGFRNSTCSYVVGLLSPKVIRDLELKRHGLNVIRRPVEGYYPAFDGPPLIYRTGAKDDFKRQLDRLRAGDGDGFERFDDDLHAVLAAVRALMLATPPNLAGGWREIFNAFVATREARRLDPRCRAILARLMTQSVGDFLDTYFGGDLVKGAFGYLGVVGNYQSVRAPGSAYVLLHHAFGESEGEDGAWGHAKGGMGSITQAMARSAEAHGARIAVAAPVKEVTTGQGRATGIVLADGRIVRARIVAANVTPRRLFQTMFDPALLPPEFRRDIAVARYASGTLRMNVALSELPRFTRNPGTEENLTGSISIAPSLAYLDAAFDDSKSNGLPRRPVVEVCIPSTIDRTLAPEGRHVASLFCQHFAPQLPDGRRWDETKEEAADRVIDLVNELAPNFKKAVIARRVLSPADLEREFGLTNGDIFHGCLHLDQIFSLRPAPGYADYRTPVPGLYLCGSGAHPGGGVTGLPGHNAAREILRDLRRRMPRAA
jgi:phytoene dehydrogenase-like protein